MSLFARRTVAGSRSFPRCFPRTVAVIGFLLISGVAQVQTVVNLHP